VNGTLTVRAILERSPIDRIYTSQILLALMYSGAVHASLEPAVDRAAPKQEARDAPDPSAQSPADRQETNRQPAMEDASGDRARQRAAQIAKQIRLLQQGHKGRKLSSPPPKGSGEARLKGEQAFERGRRQMGYNAWGAAVKEFRKAVECCDEVEYRLCLAFAEMRAAESEDATGTLKERLQELVSEALTGDRDMAFAWHVAGQLALMDHDEGKALKAFRTALRLDPKDTESTRYVRLLESRKS
jgi:hypothetical protein